MEALRAKVTCPRPHSLQVAGIRIWIQAAWPHKALGYGCWKLGGIGWHRDEGPRVRAGAVRTPLVACRPPKDTTGSQYPPCGLPVCRLDLLGDAQLPRTCSVPSAMPHPGPGDTAVAATGVPTSLLWWGRRPRGPGWTALGWLSCGRLPSWTGPNPRGVWPNLLPEGESRLPHRGCPQDAPALKRGCHADKGGALLNRPFSQADGHQARWRGACSELGAPSLPEPKPEAGTGLHHQPRKSLRSCSFHRHPSLFHPESGFGFSHTAIYLMRKILLRWGEKNPPQHKNTPHFHLMLSIFALSLFQSFRWKTFFHVLLLCFEKHFQTSEMKSAGTQNYTCVVWSHKLSW